MSCGCECGCCAGVRPRTPVEVFNRPGLPALTYRVGAYGSFRETMQARLASRDALARLTTRDPDDPGIALLDAFAVLGDVLTFYQERIANEGYLRTATETYSLTELGNLVGYTPRPALGASTFLAYTLDPGAATLIPIGSGARSVAKQNELPQTFETMDELPARADWNTLAPARTAPVRITYYEPSHLPTTDPGDVRTKPTVLVAGTAAGLKTGDRLLFLFGGQVTNTAVRLVQRADPDFPADRTIVTLIAPDDALAAAIADLSTKVDTARATAPKAQSAQDADTTYLQPLQTALHKPGNTDLPLYLLERLAETGELAAAHESCAVVEWYTGPVHDAVVAGQKVADLLRARDRTRAPEIGRLMGAAHDLLCPPCGGGESSARRSRTDPADCDDGAALAALDTVLPALRRDPSIPPRKARDIAAPVAEQFRANSDVHPKLLIAADPRLAPNLHRAWANQQLTAPPPLSGLQVLRTKAAVVAAPSSTAPVGEVWLDAVYDQILPGTWMIATVQDSAGALHTAGFLIDAVRQDKRPIVVTTSKAALPTSVPATVLTVAGTDPWGAGNSAPAVGSAIWAQGENLTPLGDPIIEDIKGREIELAQVYSGLQPGRLLIVAGERTDVPHTAGVKAAEVTMLAGIRQRVDPNKPGAALQTFLELSGDLAYTYKRETVTVYGNVVEADQGESRQEVLGAGDATAAGQSFPIRQIAAATPLTALPADNPAGYDPALAVAVSGVRWHPTESLIVNGPTDHVYATDIAADHTVRVRFGDGTHGARPQTGVDNVTAKFRVGAGSSGDVDADQIKQLAARPLGVNAVTNPVPATGGTDGDGPADMRATMPLRMLALDRLVSVRDYEDFTRARAGFAKASARKLFDGEREVVHVTVATIGDAPVNASAELLVKLAESLRDFGDLGVPVRIAVRESVLLILRAGLAVLPDYSWDLVEPAVRAALLDEFSFARAELGSPAYLSRAIAVIQGVPGVDYVEVEVFHGVPGTTTALELVTLATKLKGAQRRIAAGPAHYDTVSRRLGSGETLTEFAQRAGLTLAELAALNPALTVADPGSGTRLTIFRGIRPARLVVLPADVPEALTLRRIP
ncbi:putative baseplate assembly protein [Nocardia panacis]|uniref:Putative baseplate assembly protein n=1 Tax=Nocardia panacis TaxID=2340916 RepID=A0A3A4KMT7_9NOCA|nr:putative baseplate assembly protein [Nocardia panacis]RJO70856.1 putative baseplate assembly protein [Nocardia panacis]